LKDTDWSVDRINNDGAYAAGNLMVMSTKANGAKGAKHYVEIASLAAIPAHETSNGLSGREWARIACLMVGAEGLTDDAPALGPLLTRIPEDCRVPLFFLVQQMVLVAGRTSSLRNRMVRSLNRLHAVSDKHLALSFAAERLARLRRHVEYEYDALADETVLRLLRSWYTSLPPTSNYGLLRFCTAYGANHLEPSLPRAWSIQTHGRF
jgi:hypothetical protein